MTDQPKIHPERKRRVRGALAFFTFAAWTTGVLLLALCVRMIAQYVLGMSIPEWATWIARIHGWFYLVFVFASLNLGLKARWDPKKWITTALCGVVPFLSFWVEAVRRKEVTKRFQLHSA